jgi:hypothetical protein
MEENKIFFLMFFPVDYYNTLRRQRMHHTMFMLVLLAIVYTLSTSLGRYRSLRREMGIDRKERDQHVLERGGVSARIQGFFVPKVNDTFGGVPGAPADWVIAKVKSKWKTDEPPIRPRQETSNSAVVLGKDGMPLYGIASTTSFWDADMTACGKQPTGKLKTWEGDRNDFRKHGPLAAINHRWYKTQYSNDPPYNVASQDFYSKSIRATNGFCNAHCYELTALRPADGRTNDMPKVPIVVKIADECTDAGYCDATELCANTHTSGISRNASNAWPIGVPTHVHFDVMAASLMPNHPWYKYSLNVRGASTNFLVRFKRVTCPV